MNRNLRLKVAREYLSLLVKHGVAKVAMLKIRAKYGASRSRVYAYVNELRVN